MRTIVLTGATGGLGRCLADDILADRQDRLICVYRNQAKFDALFSPCQGIVHSYLLKKRDEFADLTDILKRFETNSVLLILTACSIVPIKRVGDFLPEEIVDVTYGNVTQNVLLLNRTVAFCKEHRKKLRVIHIDSGAADRPLKGWANYCAAKAYMNAMLSVIQEENPDYQVVSFDPGVVDTGMQESIRSTSEIVFDQVGTFIGYQEKGVLRRPQDVAKQIMDRYVHHWVAEQLREAY